MKRRTILGLAVLGSALGLLAIATDRTNGQAGGWITLLDAKAKKMGDWDRIGDANWRLEGDAVVADKKAGKETAHLVSKASYKDFELRAEFWADEDCNSGIFIRLSDPKKITSKNAYEVNIFDKRSGPEYGTGAIVNFAKVSPMPKAAGRWNTFEITAKGSRLTVKMNGVQTADIEEKSFAAGPISLQYGAGAIKWRKVEIRPL